MFRRFWSWTLKVKWRMFINTNYDWFLNPSKVSTNPMSISFYFKNFSSKVGGNDWSLWWIVIFPASLRVRSSLNHFDTKVRIECWAECKETPRLDSYWLRFPFDICTSIFYLRCAGEIKKSEPSEDEHYIISKALHTVKYCELLPQDQKMFRQILDKVIW